MKRWRAIARVGLLITALTTLLSVSTAFAATTTATPAPANPGNALRISPVRQDLTIKPGASQTVDIYVQNLTPSPVTLQAIINDFTASNDESGTPSILLNANSYAPSHGLKRYIQSVSNITLHPNEQKDVKVTIAIPKDAAGGGYFGAVRFAPTSADSSKNVSLTASVGSLLLVTVPGNITEKLSVASFNVATADPKTGVFKVNSFFTSNKGINAFMRFSNIGNVQLEPFGRLQLKKSGKVVASYEVNNTDPRGNVLPDSIRHFATPLPGVGSFGKYTLEGNFGYGTKGQLLTASTTFYVVPIPLMAGVLGVIIIVLLLIFVVPRVIRAYNRRIISQANKTKR